jgi:hypothetical protein
MMERANKESLTFDEGNHRGKFELPFIPKRSKLKAYSVY